MRTTISLDDTVVTLAERIAEKESRSFSNLCEVALKEYCGDRAVGPDEAEILAAAKELGDKDAAIAALKREARKQRKAT